MMAPFALDTRDLDQARELVGGLIAPFGLTPCRKAGYRARIRAGRIGQLGVAEVSYRRAVDIVGDVPAGAHILEIPTSGQCRARRPAGVRDAGRGDIVATAPGQPVGTWMGDGSRLLVIRIPTAALDPSGNGQILDAGDGGNGEGIGRRVGLWTPAPSLSPWRLASVERLARLTFEAREAGGALSSDGTLAAELQHVMLALLGAPHQRGPGSDEGDGVPGPLPRAVRQAQALMIAAPDGALSLGALAGRCGVGVRTLQENFRQFTGQTPGEWWRGYRLDRVRAILNAGRPGTRVTDAATAFGFYHLGRFAEQYRRRFGEPPSETLRRAERDRPD